MTGASEETTARAVRLSAAERHDREQLGTMLRRYAAHAIVRSGPRRWYLERAGRPGYWLEVIIGHGPRVIVCGDGINLMLGVVAGGLSDVDYLRWISRCTPTQLATKVIESHGQDYRNGKAWDEDVAVGQAHERIAEWRRSGMRKRARQMIAALRRCRDEGATTEESFSAIIGSEVEDGWLLSFGDVVAPAVYGAHAAIGRLAEVLTVNAAAREGTPAPVGRPPEAGACEVDALNARVREQQAAVRDCEALVHLCAERWLDEPGPWPVQYLDAEAAVRRILAEAGAPNDLSTLVRRVGAWHATTFAAAGVADAGRKLVEEAVELALAAGTPADDVVARVRTTLEKVGARDERGDPCEEAAGVFIVLAALVSRWLGGVDGLATTVAAKHARNIERAKAGRWADATSRAAVEPPC